MTYPQQQYQGQPYSPADQFQGQQGYYGAPQQGYAPPPQQYPPQPAPPAQAPPAPAAPTGGAALPAVPPPLATGGGNAGGSWPKMRHLQGCTLIFVPLRVDEERTVVVNRNGVKAVEPQPEAYFHLIVVDSPTGKIQYGDSLDESDPKPLAWERATPCLFTNVNDYGWGPVSEVRNALAAGEPARVGVVERGTQGNKPYLITKPDKMVGGADRPDGDARFQRAAQVWNQAFAALNGNPAAFNNPTPRALLAPPAAAPQQVAYGQPGAYPQPTPAQQYAPPAGYPAGPGAAPLAQSPYMPQGYATPNTGAGVPQQYAPQPAQSPMSAPPAAYPPGYGQYAPPQQPTAFAQAAAPAVQSTGNPAFDAYIASLPAEQQGPARAQFATQGQFAAQPAGPGI